MTPEDKKTPDDKSVDDKKPTDDKPADASGEPDEKMVPISISRKWETRAKENYEAKQELDALKESQKSDTQKLADKATASEKVAATAQGELLRLRVAMRKGLTEPQAKRLIGTTEEELEADADELLDSFTDKTPADKDGKPTRPKERLRSGAAPDEEPDETDPRKLAATVPRL